MSKVKYIVFFTGAVFIIVSLGIQVKNIYSSISSAFKSNDKIKTSFFEVQSVDTMKYSRDQARAALKNPNVNRQIDDQVKLVAELGATHIAISTPYDEEFILVLKKWVASARKNNLSVWFRGNFSGWEGWFDYSRISEAQHAQQLENFIRKHPDLFQDGDIFMPCPECENGGLGDPRRTGNVKGYRDFLIKEYKISNDAFKKIGKDVVVYSSMNGDIAEFIMNQDSISKIGGIVMIDHYTPSVGKFTKDINRISKKLESEIGLGEFGAPIPDLNGVMSPNDQGAYVEALMDSIYANNKVSKVNYWTLKGGSTEIISDNLTPKPAYYALQKFYSAPTVYGRITDNLGNPINKAEVIISSTTQKITTDEEGFYQVFLPTRYKNISITKNGYYSISLSFPVDLASSTKKDINLTPQNPSAWYSFKYFLYSKINQIIN